MAWGNVLGVLLMSATVLVGARFGLAQAQPGAGHESGMTMDPARQYIEWMIPHHEDAIRMAGLALAQAEHPEIRAMAADINQTQADEIRRMRQWYQSWYGTDVPPMSGDMMDMMGGHDASLIDGARPFDRAFIEQMIPHHESAVAGSRMMLPRVDRPELRELLESVITNQSREIAQMRAWYQEWYGAQVPDTQGPGMHEMMPGMMRGESGASRR